jgi:hypothetical protein
MLKNPREWVLYMPTVIRFSRFRVVIYPNDHRPAHVHVIGPDVEAVFVLNCPDGPPALRESMGLSAPELNVIADHLGSKLTTLCPAWKSIHHDY